MSMDIKRSSNPGITFRAVKLLANLSHVDKQNRCTGRTVEAQVK